MFLRELTDSVSSLKGAGPAAEKAFAAAGIHSVASLLARYPRSWEDRSRLVPLKDWAAGPVCTDVTILAHDWFGFGPMKTLKIYVEDESARAALVCFNRSFLTRQLPVGMRCRLWGKFFYKYGELQASAFETESMGKTGTILPVYPLSGELTQKMLRRSVGAALACYGPHLEDELPADLILREGLFSKAEAIRAIHFPASLEALERAKKTLIWEELFYLEIIVGRRALERRPAAAVHARAAQTQPGGGAPVNGSSFSPLQQKLLDRLPFSLTAGQLAAAADINADMTGPYAMVRLLEGDVGSGKTLVAFLAALRALEGTGQAAIMAPTELLARQHAENAARLLEPLGIRPAYLTGNLRSSGRAQLLKALVSGEVDIVLGTHALFSKDVVYRNLRLVVIDEQHRFGVTQRQKILAKGRESGAGRVPDLLMMSATPIPRTLALTVFGDLDVSVIRDMPPGRKPVKTHLARESNQGKVYDFIRRELAQGRQAYFVYPLIGDEDAPDTDSQDGLKNAVSMAEKLSKEIFPEYPTALLHSKIDDEEKRKIMEAFRKGDIAVLAATSVVEVGVDVPAASCMVIHHAERFGLSALHQLRGRVGRGESQGYCFLVYSEETVPETDEQKPALTDDGKQRLKVMLETNDGFVIAEEDLKLRGPGQIAGIEQSGYLKLGIADPVQDSEILMLAREAAFSALKADPGLLLPEHRCIAGVLERCPPFTETGF